MSEESSSYSPSSSRSSSASSSPQKITGVLKTLKAKSGKRLEALTELEELQKEILHQTKNLVYYQRKASECLTRLTDSERKKQKLLAELDEEDVIVALTQSTSASKSSRFSALDKSHSGGSLSAQFALHANQGLRDEWGGEGESSVYQVKK